MLINLLIHYLKILAERPVLNWLKLGQTKTGLFAVQSSLFDFWEKGRLVMVMVKALGHQKTRPDWTFKH